jgi:hypothetical protein
MAGPGLLANVIVCRFDDHLPYNRLENVYEREGTPLAHPQICLTRPLPDTGGYLLMPTLKPSAVGSQIPDGPGRARRADEGCDGVENEAELHVGAARGRAGGRVPDRSRRGSAEARGAAELRESLGVDGWCEADSLYERPPRPFPAPLTFANSDF